MVCNIIGFLAERTPDVFIRDQPYLSTASTFVCTVLYFFFNNNVIERSLLWAILYLSQCV
jgi:hypothetical protein